MQNTLSENYEKIKKKINDKDVDADNIHNSAQSKIEDLKLDVDALTNVNALTWEIDIDNIRDQWLISQRLSGQKDYEYIKELIKSVYKLQGNNDESSSKNEIKTKIKLINNGIKKLIIKTVIEKGEALRKDIWSYPTQEETIYNEITSFKEYVNNHFKDLKKNSPNGELTDEQKYNKAKMQRASDVLLHGFLVISQEVRDLEGYGAVFSTYNNKSPDLMTLEEIEADINKEGDDNILETAAGKSRVMSDKVRSAISGGITSIEYSKNGDNNIMNLFNRTSWDYVLLTCPNWKKFLYSKEDDVVFYESKAWDWFTYKIKFDKDDWEIGEFMSEEKLAKDIEDSGELITNKADIFALWISARKVLNPKVWIGAYLTGKWSFAEEYSKKYGRPQFEAGLFWRANTEDIALKWMAGWKENINTTVLRGWVPLSDLPENEQKPQPGDVITYKDPSNSFWCRFWLQKNGKFGKVDFSFTGEAGFNTVVSDNGVENFGYDFTTKIRAEYQIRQSTKLFTQVSWNNSFTQKLTTNPKETKYTWEVDINIWLSVEFTKRLTASTGLQVSLSPEEKKLLTPEFVFSVLISF